MELESSLETQGILREGDDDRGGERKQGAERENAGESKKKKC